MKKITILALLGLNVALMQTSHANEWSIAGLVGQSSFDLSEGNCIGSCEIDDSDTSMGISVAYGFTENWGLEAGYIDFGSANVNGSLNTFTYQATADASAIYLTGTGTYFFSDQVSITGRLGIASLDVKASALTFSESDSSEEVMLGVSADYHFNDQISTGLRFDSVSDVDAISLTFKYRFGNK